MTLKKKVSLGGAKKKGKSCFLRRCLSYRILALFIFSRLRKKNAGYVDRAAAEKEAYLQHIAEIKKLGGRLPGEVLASSADDAGGGETGDEKELAIPIARIRKIVNLDEDISSLSKDAVVFLR